MDQRVAAASSNRNYWTKDDIRNKIEKSRVLVFSKGTHDHPRCGFSAKALQAVKDCGHPHEVVDVCEDSSIVAALRAVAGRNNSRLPLIYVGGDLVGTSETLENLVSTGELKEKVEAQFGSE